jgi:hypothetical protein
MWWSCRTPEEDYWSLLTCARHISEHRASLVPKWLWHTNKDKDAASEFPPEDLPVELNQR